MAALCPKCAGNPPLVEYADQSGVAYDSCTECKGVWLDKGELARLLGGAPGADATLLGPKPSQSLCPRCRLAMQNGGFLSPALRLDACAACGGTWLDPGELRVVRKLLAIAEPVGPAAAVAVTPAIGVLRTAPPAEPVQSPQSIQPAPSAPALAPAALPLPSSSPTEMINLLAWMVLGGGAVAAGMFLIGRPVLARLGGSDLSVDQARLTFDSMWQGFGLIIAGATLLIWRPTLAELLKFISESHRLGRRRRRSLFDA